MLVNACASIANISADQLGANLAVWYDITTPTFRRQLAQVGAHILRWPGGSTADVYHWRHNTQCTGGGTSYTSHPAYSPNSTFDNLMKDVAIPGNYDVAITVAYGTNAACNGGGDPAEAAAWVAHVKAKGWDSKVKYWTVGNEVFGNWEVDLHSMRNNAATYARAMSGPNGYYALMKAADPHARVGVVVTGGAGYDNWDGTVLSRAPYDFVELHWYAQQPGKENDNYLIDQAPTDFARAIGALRSELEAFGKPNTPIMVGELNSVTYNPGKQTVSIVNGLFGGQALAEGIKAGLAADIWWFGDGNVQFCGNNSSSSLYGFQNWGSEDLVFANTASAYNGCKGHGPVVPEGTVSPSGQAFKLVSDFARPGQKMLAAASGSSAVRVYAATLPKNGYAVLLFNLDETTPAAMRVVINGAAASHYAATEIVYGKKQYDTSQKNVWTGPVSTSLGTVGSTIDVTLQPWSITLLRLR